MAVPSPRTFEQLKDSILRYLKLTDDTEADALAADAIRGGLVRLAAYPLKSMLSTAVLTMTTSTHELTLPTDFSMSFSLHLLDTNSLRDGRVVYKREEDFDYIVESDEGVSGSPEIFTVRGGGTTLEFDRTPTTEVVSAHPTVRLRYFKRVDQLVSSTDTFSLAPEIEEFLIWFGRSQLAPLYDAKMFGLAQQESNRALADAIKRDSIRDEQDWV
jgi:hypothetical protein